jgi:cell division protein FtsQ
VLRRLLTALVVAGLVVGAGWLVFFSSVLDVEGVEVAGTAVLTNDQVVETAAVPEAVPLARVDLDAVRARVEGLAAVRSAEVSRAWPDQVRIDVTEREAVAVVSWEGQWRGLDRSGVLFRSYESRPLDLPRVDMRASTPVEALAEAAGVVTSLPQDLLSRVEYLDVGSIDAISLRLKSAATVTWGSADQSEDKAAVLAVLLDQPARAYDVSAPGRPTLRR